MLGEILALSSAICIGLSNVFVKNVTPRFGTLYLTALRLAISLVMAIAAGFIFSDMSSLLQMEFKYFAILLIAVCFTCLLALVLKGFLSAAGS